MVFKYQLPQMTLLHHLFLLKRRPVLITFFNKCFHHLNANPKIKRECLGYTSNTLNFINHWSQFSDNTAFVTAFDPDNQYLLNLLINSHFGRFDSLNKENCDIWCPKPSTAVVAFEPHLMIYGQKVSNVKKDDNLKYLVKSSNSVKDLYL